MIPSQPLGTSSNAEMRMFDQLRAAFARPDQTGWFAMHSLNLAHHEYKRFGELDFVIGGPDGLFVIEVKGGGVSCHDGIWETTNQYGETQRLRELPFKQAFIQSVEQYWSRSAIKPNRLRPEIQQ